MEGLREARSNALLDLLAFACRWSRLYYYKNRFGARASAHHPYMDEPPFTTDVQVGDLPLQPGATMTYLYDFGDHWEFDVQLERIDPVDPRLQKPRILETRGRAPKQYSDWPDR